MHGHCKAIWPLQSHVAVQNFAAVRSSSASISYLLKELLLQAGCAQGGNSSSIVSSGPGTSWCLRPDRLARRRCITQGPGTRCQHSPTHRMCTSRSENRWLRSLHLSVICRLSSRSASSIGVTGITAPLLSFVTPAGTSALAHLRLRTAGRRACAGQAAQNLCAAHLLLLIPGRTAGGSIPPCSFSPSAAANAWRLLSIACAPLSMQHGETASQTPHTGPQ